MRMNKRQNCLNTIKSSFHQSGYVDWHISPRLSNDSQDESEGEIAVQTARPELKRPPMYAVVLMNDDYTPIHETLRKRKRTKSIIMLGHKVIHYFVRLSQKIKGITCSVVN